MDQKIDNTPDELIPCPDCEGGGFIAKLYPSGHVEKTCETCDGYGYIDAEGG